MVSTQLAIVYGLTDNKVHARVASTSSDDELLHHLNNHINLGPDEAYFLVQRTDLVAQGHHQLLANHTGKPVVTKTGTVMPAAVVV